MARRYEGATFVKACKTLTIWNSIKPSLEKVKLGGSVRVPLSNGKIGIFHLVAIDHYPREKGFDYDWYYLLFCRNVENKENVERKGEWVPTRIKRWLLNVIKS